MGSKTSIYSKALKQKIKEDEEALEKALPKEEDSKQVQEASQVEEDLSSVPESVSSIPPLATGSKTSETKRSWGTYFLILLGLVMVVLFFGRGSEDKQAEILEQELLEALVPSKYESDENSLNLIGDNSEGQVYYPQNGGFSEFEKGEQGDIVFSYDVTSENTYAGIRFKSEGVDLSKFSELVVRVLPMAGQVFPTRFHVELKSAGRVIRILHAKDLMPLGEARSFHLNFSSTTPLSEIALFLKHSTLDSSSQKGAFKLTHLHLVPKS